MGNNIQELTMNIIANGDVEKAIAILRDWTYKEKHEFHKDIVQLSSQYAVYRRKRNLILGDDEKLDKDLNRITFSLIDYISQLEIPPSSRDNSKQEVFLYEPDIFNENKKTFIDWAINDSRVSLIVLILGSLGVLVSIIALSNGIVEQQIGGSSSTLGYKYYSELSNFAIWANIVVAIIVLIVHSKSTKFIDSHFNEYLDNDLKAYIDRSKRAVSDFNLCWSITWTGWLLLYTSYLISEHELGYNLIGKDNYKEFMQILSNLFSNISSLGLISCFAILFYKKKTSNKSHYNTPLTITVLASIIITLVLEILLFYYADSDVTMLMFELVIGIVSAISIALLMGRLDSKFINASIGLIFLIYIYAGIQPLSGFFGENFLNTEFSNISSIIQAFALNYALFAKSLLFILVYWLLMEGKLQTYLIRLNSIIKNIE